MAKGMGADYFRDACFRGEVFANQENHHTTQAGTTAIEENEMSSVFFNGYGRSN